MGYAVVAVEKDADMNYCAMVVECKEVLKQRDSMDGLTKETLQQRMDDLIEKY